MLNTANLKEIETCWKCKQTAATKICIVCDNIICDLQTFSLCVHGDAGTGGLCLPCPFNWEGGLWGEKVVYVGTYLGICYDYYLGGSYDYYWGISSFVVFNLSYLSI